jgi:antitoxin (DNA-binding transcriptional repressor) of toxin-antitoxin stability system
MNSITANVTDVSRHFSEYLNRAAYSGESFVIVRGGRALAELKPLPRSKKISELAKPT